MSANKAGLRQHDWRPRTKRIDTCTRCGCDKRQGVRVNFYRHKGDSDWYSSAMDPWCKRAKGTR